MKPQAQPALQLEQFIPYRLSVLSNAVSSSIADAYRRRHSLSIPEWRIMAVLARYPGISAREVGDKTRMDAVAVSRAVNRLLRARRLKRGTADNDRRKSILTLSDQGFALYREIVPFALQYEAALLAVLQPFERRIFDDILKKLTDHAQHLEARAQQLEAAAKRRK